MKISQWSDWSYEPHQNVQRRNSITSKNKQSRDNTWTEDNNEKTRTKLSRIAALQSLICGCLIGSLLCGIALAAVLTLWLTSVQSTTTSSTISTAAIIITSTTTIIRTTSQLKAQHCQQVSQHKFIFSKRSFPFTSTTATTSSTTSTTADTTTTTWTTTSPPNLLVNPGAEDGILSPWISGGTGVPTINDGSTNAGCNPSAGTKQFYGGAIGSGSSNTLTQSVLLLNSTQGYTEAQLDSGNLSAYISFYEQSYYQYAGTDEGQISLAFRTLNNTLISTTMGTRRIDYIMIFQRITGTFIDAYFDDNYLKVY